MGRERVRALGRVVNCGLASQLACVCEHRSVMRVACMLITNARQMAAGAQLTTRLSGPSRRRTANTHGEAGCIIHDDAAAIESE
jgi:hypothetical protein